MQASTPFIETLTSEIHHRPLVGLITIVVLLLHLWLVVLLMQPSDSDHDAKPIKIMEVTLVPETKPKPIIEPAPPAPPKKIIPKKKEIKPPVKKKIPVIDKQGNIAIPKTVTKEPTKELPIPTPIVQKTEAPQSATVSKPVGKPSNVTAKSTGSNSGLVELGCPKPKYPIRAMSRHIEGWVKIELTISASGTVANARVVGAQPSGIFEEAALDATRNCRFKPKIVNGAPTTQVGTKVSRFKLAN